MTKIGRNNIVLNSLSVMTYCEVNKSIRIFKFLLHRCDRNYRCRIRQDLKLSALFFFLFFFFLMKRS